MKKFNLNIIPVTPIQQNCSLLTTEDGKGVIVDPGGNPQKLFQYIKENNIDLEAILLTHGHFDHIGAVEDLRQLAESHLDKTIPVLGPFEQDSLMFNAVESRAGSFFALDPSIDDLNLKDFNQDPSKGDRFFQGPVELFTVGEDFAFEVVHTPGHSPGHAIIKILGTNIILVGDLIFRESVGRTDLEGGDFDTLAQSVKESIFTLDDDTILFPGHGPRTTVAHEKAYNPYVRP